MALRYCILASGSKGNATYIGNQNQGVLVDNGLSGVELIRRMESAGLAPHSVKGVIITHEHRDHSSGAGIIARKLRVPIAATNKTWAACRGVKKTRRQVIKAGDAFSMAGLEFQPFSIPHDAADTIGLVISSGPARLGLCTDLGKATGLVRTRLAGCQALILESNHDPRMLAEGPYPVWLKQRVRSSRGHLSNQDGAELLSGLVHPGLSHVTLAHLSETNNKPELARKQAGRVLESLHCSAKLIVARQDQPSPVIELG